MKCRLLFLLPVLFFISLTASKCKKDKTSANPIDQLPPATQTGNHTLGFLLNGEAWKPKGFFIDGGTTNLSIYYDQSYRGGAFNISTYRQLSQDNKQNFGIGMDSLQEIGIYYAYKNSNLKFVFIDRLKGITFNAFDSTVFCNGKLDISKLDKINQIISGTFSVTLFKIGNGDSVKITEGRFDMNY